MYFIAVLSWLLLIHGSLALNCRFNSRNDDNLSILAEHGLLASSFSKTSTNASCLLCSPKIGSENFIYTLGGFAISSRRRHQSQLPSGVVETSLVYEFSDHERQVSEAFIADNGDRGLHVLSPGFLQLPSKRFFVVSRIWFSKAQVDNDSNKYIYENMYPENFAYQQVFSQDFSRQEIPGSLLPIPTPTQFLSGGGPSDPRVFKLGDSVFVSFYMIRDIENSTGRIFLWDATKRRMYQPRVEDFKLASIESNWTPFEFGGKLHFIYMFNPLRVLKCEVTADVVCRLVFEQARGSLLPLDGNPNVQDLPDSNSLILRGGTPLLHYVTTTSKRALRNFLRQRSSSYYLTVVHSTVHIDENGYLNENSKRRYNAHFVLMRVDGDGKNQLLSMCIVFISNKLQVGSQVFNKTRLVLPDQISEPFIFPVGLVLLDENSTNDNIVDCVLVSYHISDDKSFISRFCGLKSLLSPVISEESACLTDTLSPETINKFIIENLI